MLKLTSLTYIKILGIVVVFLISPAIVGAQVDTIPPTVTIKSPQNNSYVKGGNIQFKAQATDNVGISKVEFYVDNVLLGTGTVSPYVVIWDTRPLIGNSVHTLFVKAYDTSNNSVQSSTFTVTIDKTLPIVSFTNPLNGSTVAADSTVTITVNASDNASLLRVGFLVDGTKICADKISPYSCDWTVPSTVGTTYILKANAVDTAGNNKAATITVTSTFAASYPAPVYFNSEYVTPTYITPTYITPAYGTPGYLTPPPYPTPLYFTP